MGFLSFSFINKVSKVPEGTKGSTLCVSWTCFSSIPSKKYQKIFHLILVQSSADHICCKEIMYVCMATHQGQRTTVFWLHTWSVGKDIPLLPTGILSTMPPVPVPGGCQADKYIQKYGSKVPYREVQHQRKVFHPEMIPTIPEI